MKSLIRWVINNTPAMNTLMIAIIVVGAVSLQFMRREVFPEFELEIILVTVPYPGASPAEVEEGICQKIEESVRSIAGIKKLSSVAREGAGALILELESNVRDVQKILNEVRSEIDRIPSFPELAEDPEVTQVTFREAAIRIGVIGPDRDDGQAELELREVTERVRNDLLHLPSVSQAEIVGAKDYQIDIEILEATLREYGLTLKEVAQTVRRENVELPGGKMKTDSHEVLLRGKNKHLVGSEIAKIPLVTQPNGVVLTVGDLGVVRDEFADTTALNRIDRRPGLVISVNKTSSEDLLKIVKEVNQYVESTRKPGDPHQLPPGYELKTWADRSIMVQDRIDLLSRNGFWGLVLVFVVLAVFLERRLAFWVALGIPISMFGACAILLAMDQTLNMLSMFAFLMALGILVDDAIVVGENVYAHRQHGKGFIAAAVDGTCEVLPSVLASVTTTIIAFSALLFVPGVMGKFIAVMPLAVIVMLAISLFESTFILPCHLAHSGERAALAESAKRTRHTPLWFNIGWTAVWLVLCVTVAAVSRVELFPAVAERLQQVPAWMYDAVPAAAERLQDVLPWIPVVGPVVLLTIALAPWLWHPLRRLGDGLGWLNVHVSDMLQWIITRWYSPMLRFSLDHPAITLSAAATILILTAGLIRSEKVPYTFFPELDGNDISATIAYPDGTSAAATRVATERLEWAIREVDREYGKKHGHRLVDVIHRAVGDVRVVGNARPDMSPGGSHTGGVGVELVQTDAREISSEEVIRRWRKKVGTFPGAESLTFSEPMFGPGGTPIEFKLLARPENMESLEKVVQKCKDKLAASAGVFDIADNSQPGKAEYQITVKDRAKAMGVTLADLAETVRGSYYGEEVMRLQRGRHEVKLMVRYPRSERASLANFDDIRVRVGDGSERPLTELAEVKVEKGYSEIHRLDQLRAITITADVDEKVGRTWRIVREMQNDFMPDLLKEYPNVAVRWEGEQEQTNESMFGLYVGLGIALVVMFALLTLEFRSYAQPLLILAIVPFGFVGAVLGHLFRGLPLTIFSVFGLVALTGVVVNDSIVLIDFINHRVRDNVPLKEALIDAGRRRFRPVMLTSMTTIAGLLPILAETSLQAQVVIPMATSLAFGLLFTTLLMLTLVPTFYLIYARVTGTGVQHAEAVVASELPPPPARPGAIELDEDELEVLLP